MKGPILNFNGFTQALNEQQSVPLLATILKAPSAVQISGQDNSNLIYLTKQDPKSPSTAPKNYPAQTYKVTGTYDAGALVPNINFDVRLRGVSRDSEGNLLAEAQPTNKIVLAAMKKLIPSESLTGDGWLSVKVPRQKVNSAIDALKKSGGTSALMDAGEGISIGLRKV